MAKSIGRLAFIGSGNMGSAIIRGFMDRGGVSPKDIFVYDKECTNYPSLQKCGVNTFDSLEAAIHLADFIFLCVKPQGIASVVSECCSFDNANNSVFVSIAASVSTDMICRAANKTIPIIRTMPNTPMLIGEGAIAICKNDLVDNKKFANVCRLFSSIAVVSVMDEALLNPIISVSGSSPAYVYYFIKSILDVAIEQGISKEQALPLITQTLIGSAKMVEQSDCPIDDLIARVCSPKGTTLEAMNVLRDDGFSDLIKNAMLACSKRADEISAELQS